LKFPSSQATNVSAQRFIHRGIKLIGAGLLCVMVFIILNKKLWNQRLIMRRPNSNYYQICCPRFCDHKERLPWLDRAVTMIPPVLPGDAFFASKERVSTDSTTFPPLIMRGSLIVSNRPHQRISGILISRSRRPSKALAWLAAARKTPCLQLRMIGVTEPTAKPAHPADHHILIQNASMPA
jgi:hypothetical protein